MTVQQRTCLLEVLNDGMHASANHVADPERCKTEGCNGEDETDDRETLVPSGIGELLVMGIGNLAKEYLTHNTQDVDRRDNDW